MASRQLRHLSLPSGITRAAFSASKPRLQFTPKLPSTTRMSTIAAFKIPKVANEPNVRIHHSF